MQEIDCPLYSGVAVFKECTAIKRDKGLKKRLMRMEEYISTAELIYKKKSVGPSFHEIEPDSFYGKCVTRDEMEDLYTSVFARGSSSVRKKYYDELMLAPENGVCPMCGQRDVSTLDHYLPKAKNPGFAVMPINLVPVCKECNHTKFEHQPDSAGRQFIHPYYDKLPAGIWLTANLERSRPPALLFRVEPPEDCDEIMASRLIWHFQELGLAKLYASQAGKTLAGIADKLCVASDRGGKDEVRFVLNEDARSWGRINLNGWHAAMYRTLAESDWFCEEGYAYAGEKRKNMRV